MGCDAGIVYAVGIDLAWSPRNPTGLAVAKRVGSRWVLRMANGDLDSNAEIISTIANEIGSAPAIVAIDAPLVVPFERRGREGDRYVTRVFGPMEAGVYPATRRKIRSYGGNRIWDLVEAFQQEGFRHDCRVTPSVPTRLLFETYPHAAMVALFDLSKTLKYKTRQGRTMETRLKAYRKFESHLRALRRFRPPLEGTEAYFDSDLEDYRGSALKEYEDRLDAILCAYVAAYYWTWGTQRCAIFGSLEGGYIVTPMSPEIAQRIPPNASVVAYTGKLRRSAHERITRH